MLPIIILTLACFSLCALLIAASHFFGPKSSPSSGKASDYECGLSPRTKAPSKVSVQFFLTAILFILFDIEIIFMYPFAVSYREFLNSPEGPGILLAMAFFILVFIFGLWWEIKTKALSWNK